MMNVGHMSNPRINLELICLLSFLLSSLLSLFSWELLKYMVEDLYCHLRFSSMNTTFVINFEHGILVFSGLCPSTFADLHFSWRIEFYGHRLQYNVHQHVGLLQLGVHIGHCKPHLVGSRGNAPGSFGYFIELRFSNSLSMHHLLT